MIRNKQQVTSSLLRSIADAMDALSEDEFKVVLNAAGLRRLVDRERFPSSQSRRQPDVKERVDALMNGLAQAPTREDARSFLEESAATKAVLLAAARSRDVHVLKQDTVSILVDKLVANTVGSRLDSAAIRNG